MGDRGGDVNCQGLPSNPELEGVPRHDVLHHHARHASPSSSCPTIAKSGTAAAAACGIGWNDSTVKLLICQESGGEGEGEGEGGVTF